MRKSGNRSPREGKGQGFTLIELLVVSASIASLAAILFPVFARARENARKSNCQSNFKQIGLGIMQYVQDYDERYPREYQVTSGPTPRVGDWCNTGAYTNIQDDLVPYIKNTGVWKCPSTTRTAEACTGYNYWLNSRALATINEPANLVVSLDTTWEWFGDGYRAEGNRVESRHMDGFNCLFGDGHVKWQKRSNMLRKQLDESLPAEPW